MAAILQQVQDERNGRLCCPRPGAAGKQQGRPAAWGVFPLLVNARVAGKSFPLILNLLKDGQRWRERSDGPEWRRAILQQVQDERMGVPVQDERMGSREGR